MKNLSELQIIVFFLPLAIIQFSLATYCTVKILKEGVSVLNKWVWIVIAYASVIGSVLFLVFGKRRDLY